MKHFNNWFSIRFRKLLIFFGMAAVIPSILFFIISNIFIFCERKNEITQLTQVLQAAIVQNNRMMLEIFLKKTMDDLNSPKAMLFFKNRVIMEFSPPKNRKIFLTTTEKSQLPGMPNYHIEIELPLLTNVSFLAFPLIAAFVFSIIVLSFSFKLKKELIQNIIVPLKMFVKDQKKESYSKTEIYEISDLLGQYLNHLMEIGRFSLVREQLYKAEAIAKTTQMLAHDVRKPFTILQGIIAVLDDAKDISDFKSKLPQMLDTVQRSLTSVDGLIKDVLEIGRSNEILPEPTSLQTLFEIFLNDLAKVYINSTIEIESYFKTFVYANIETNKVLRVFLNIAGNAIEAMKHKGKLWFKTDLVNIDDKSFIEFRIGNNGPAIPSDAIPKLFESFYTSGKQGGTGLGLAIAKKIVEAHGGSIRCESGEIGETEFIFTLPALTERISENFSLHKTLKEYQKSADVHISVEDKESRFEREILARIANADVKIKVLLVDDEAIYRQTLVKLLTLNSDIATHLEIIHANDSNEAYEKVENMQIDIAILDIDLGKNSENGLEIAETLNRNKFQGKICIHSNRFLSSNHVADLKVDMITRKPMDRVDILALLHAAVEKLPATPRSVENKVFHIAVVEDSEAIMYLIKKQLSQYAEVYHYLTPEIFLENFSNHSFDMVITDQNFDPLSVEKGIELAKYLKADLGYSGPVILASLELFSDIPIGVIDRSINKQSFTWNDLSDLLPKDKLESLNNAAPTFITQTKIPVPEDWDYKCPLLQSHFDFGRSRIPHERLTAEDRGLMRKLVHDLNSSIGRFSFYAEQAIGYAEGDDSTNLNRLRGFVEERISEIAPFVKEAPMEDFKKTALEFLNHPTSQMLPKLQESVTDLLYEVGKDSYYRFSNKENVVINIENESEVEKDSLAITVIINDDEYRQSILSAIENKNICYPFNHDLTLKNTAMLISDDYSLMEKAQEKQIPAVLVSSMNPLDRSIKKIVTMLEFIKNKESENGEKRDIFNR